jgi:hypothetical protein
VWDARGNRNEICGEGGMRKTMWGGGNGNGRTLAAGNGNELCGEGRRGGNGNGRTRNGSLPLTALISRRGWEYITPYY